MGMQVLGGLALLSIVLVAMHFELVLLVVPTNTTTSFIISAESVQPSVFLINS